MRTTINIETTLLNRLENASWSLKISKNELISILLSRITSKNRFKIRLYKTIKYQDSPETEWKTEHIVFEPSIYEKAQDLRRNFKFSVSWFISYAIINHLDEIEKKITESKNQNIMDNYDRNFVYIARKFENIQIFITMLGLPEAKYLKRFLN